MKLMKAIKRRIFGNFKVALEDGLIAGKDVSIMGGVRLRIRTISYHPWESCEVIF